MRIRPAVRDYDKGSTDHLLDVNEAAGLALCGRPGPWREPVLPLPGKPAAKHCDDCKRSYQVRTNHVGGRAWTGR